MNIDAVEQRARQPALIVRAAFRRATAGLRHVGEVAAAAWIHCSHELEARGIAHMRVRARDNRFTRFEWLTEGIQYSALEFRY